MSELNKDQNEMMKDSLWRSVEEYDAGGKLDASHYNEFMPGVKDEFDPEKSLSGISRRKFLALLSASAAFTAAGCSDYRDKGELMPYNKKPEEITIGEANYYASTCTGCAQACGILIKTREGRPIKVDGNPDHPVNAGKICAKGQASIMDLYDPQRFTEPQSSRQGTYDPVSWQEVDKKVIAALASGEAAFISNKVTSPTAMKLMKELQEKYDGINYYYYDLFSDENRISAWKKCYGEKSNPAVIKWDEADVILALEASLFGTDGNSLEQQRMIRSRRDVQNTKKFNRLYAAEANFTSTGANADYRLRIKPEHYYDLVLTLLNEVTKRGKGKGLVPASLAGTLGQFTAEAFAKKAGLADKGKKALNSLVGDLVSNGGKSIVYAGESVPEDVHVLVNLLNEFTGGSALYSTASANVVLHDYSTSTEIADLVKKMKSGKVKLLVNLDVNPVYHLPKEVGFEDAMKSVPLVVSLATLPDETTFNSNYVLPLNHNFESWGDARVRSNVTSTMQPVIAPLYNTRQKEAILLQWLSGKSDGYTETAYLNYIKAAWKDDYEGANFDKFWSGSLHDGVRLSNGGKIDAPKWLAEDVPAKNPLAGGKMAVILAQSYALGDGKHANNGWLQELPHPVSKITWDNYAAISEKTSKDLGVKTNSMVDVTVNGKKVTLPVLVQPGLADDTVVVELGFGRTKCPVVALEVGKDVSIFQKALNERVFTTASVVAAAGHYKLASTQDHHSYDETLVKDVKDAHLKRHIIQEATVTEYEKNPKVLKHGKHELISLYDRHDYPEVKWGMTIDLNKCTGCGNCSVACSIENNIPVVGKDQVLTGREMQWMRIDRYYAGTPEEPVASYQPMLCQHCDHAPCENVCPVVATTHSIDGLNQMVYNRCVGTRYCSNNCPYKVRRFNFFDFRDHFANGYYHEQPVNLAHNPEVTVRTRGVMEKCTFCVHRIEDARSKARVEGRPLKGSDVKTACQEACPAEAISFGDLIEKDTDFLKFHEHDLAYTVLEELNVKANVKYVARLWNTKTEEAK